MTDVARRSSIGSSDWGFCRQRSGLTDIARGCECMDILEGYHESSAIPTDVRRLSRVGQPFLVCRHGTIAARRLQLLLSFLSFLSFLLLSPIKPWGPPDDVVA